jgi:hypothetical protein
VDEDEGRLGGRWGLRGKKGKSLLDNPLMSAFTRLRSELKGVKGMLLFSWDREKAKCWEALWHGEWSLCAVIHKR